MSTKINFAFFRKTYYLPYLHNTHGHELTLFHQVKKKSVWKDIRSFYKNFLPKIKNVLLLFGCSYHIAPTHHSLLLGVSAMSFQGINSCFSLRSELLSASPLTVTYIRPGTSNSRSHNAPLSRIFANRRPCIVVVCWGSNEQKPPTWYIASCRTANVSTRMLGKGYCWKGCLGPAVFKEIFR